MNELRDLFHRLREEDLSRVPSPGKRGEEPALIERSASKGAPKGRMSGWALAIVTITIAIMLAVFQHHRPPVTESIVPLNAPTRSRLRTPGREMLSTGPQLR